MEKLKFFIKQIISFVRHPILMIYIWKTGSKNVTIGSRISIRRVNCLQLGNKIDIGNDARFLFIKEYHGKTYDPSIKIGNNVSIRNRFSALSAEPIIISDNVLIASDVLITSENHGINPETCMSYVENPLEAKEVFIGSGCWIGEKVTIMPGVKIGERCVIAANAVVTKSIPAYCMVAGIPAKIIKKYDFKTHNWINA
ncbi:acyltransferase [Clostridium sp. TF11-13AC]|uniref:acyltransferase n=1 Tax=Clostridium sp. TF11-13AC TaxID=2293053 RepID=UPI000E5492BE|nr:acyltransferase [Clostridium sp. TF11-13AC]RHU44989.1 acyltransferase [Clostridium sp. TF11-13AC]